jgi:hypothetical protein
VWAWRYLEVVQVVREELPVELEVQQALPAEQDAEAAALPEEYLPRWPEPESCLKWIVVIT